MSQDVLVKEKHPEDLFVQPLTTDEVERLGSVFSGRSVKPDLLRALVKEILLPKVATRMCWDKARCCKLRGNDVEAVVKRYNSDFHRDRYIFGTDPIARARAAWTNLSAVVYLDAACFEYIEESAIRSPANPKVIRRVFDAGSMIVFPSNLVHRAADDETLVTNRRVIICFDIEHDAPSGTNGKMEIPHCIIRMPSTFQIPVMHWFLTNQQVELYALYMIFSDGLYWWRFVPNWARKAAVARVHWQVTTPKDVPSDDEVEDTVALNASIYMVKKQKSDREMNVPDNVQFFDYSSHLGYFWRLADAYFTKFCYSR